MRCRVGSMLIDFPAVAHNGHFYEVVTGPLNQADAAAHAATLSFRGVAGHLITITSSVEQSFAVLLAGSVPVWTDVNDIASEGNFVYSSGAEAGQPLTFTSAWQAMQPDNMNNADCVQLSSTGEWTDEECTQLKAFIVEYECSPGFMFGALACEGLLLLLDLLPFLVVHFLVHSLLPFLLPFLPRLCLQPLSLFSSLFGHKLPVLRQLLHFEP